MLSDAWDTLTKTNLQRALNEVWSEEQSAGEEPVNDNEDGGVNEVTGICSKIPGFEQCGENDANDKETLNYQLKFLLLFKNDCPEEDKLFLNSFNSEKEILQNEKLPRECLDQDWLAKGDIFSVYNQKHLEQAIVLFKLFYYAETVEYMYKYAIWTQTLTNERMWSYALSVALVHRPETFGIILPPIYEMQPHLFFNSEIMNLVEDSIRNYNLHEEHSNTIVNDDKLNRYTNLDVEQLLTYFTEDVGLNLFYYMYHIFYPWWMDGVEFGLMADQRGEFFYYVMAQCVARYNAERLSNGLDEVAAINFESPLDVGYYPGLRYQNGVEFPSRPEGVCLKDVRRSSLSRNSNYTNAYTRLRDFAFRIQNVVDLGRAYTAGDIYKKGDEGLEVLSNLLEGNPNSPELPYYGTLQIYARHLIGYAPEPLNRDKAIPAATEHYETTMRDPASWRFFKWLLNFYDDFYKHVEPYTKKELEFPGVNIQSINADEVVTYMDHFLPDLSQSSGLNENVDISIRQKRLNSLPWVYNISVTSNADQNALVKVFIGPKYDRYGHELDIKENNDKFYVIDHIVYQLKKGHNFIVRNVNEDVAGTDRTSYKELIQRVSKAIKNQEEFIIHGSEAYWTFPRRLLLPRGTTNGMKFQLYAIIMPAPSIEQSVKADDGVYRRVGTGRHSGFRLRFPLDRKIGKSFSVPNSFVSDITIRYDDKLIL
ncbi:larval storage protein/phenoloxidase [Holotrichia oblita]|uniref:Larval storage protein/phenoloxidase n=1 Tax=Holotrichia oblita TaxID=644536 RepID=A0ACB9SM07_HOLOL|nr:larval storage protein/phenoloxidase [Holotrichia oblita]